jgi:NAD(P)-dependent dehydrogenase (short-subunit alcohol dehydrogenase family)
LRTCAALCAMTAAAARVVLITGGARGIGKAAANLFAHQGCSVVVVSRSHATDKAFLASLPSTGTPHMGLECDVGDAASIERTAATVTSTFGRVDVLVNCAGTPAPVIRMCASPCLVAAVWRMEGGGRATRGPSPVHAHNARPHARIHVCIHACLRTCVA